MISSVLLNFASEHKDIALYAPPLGRLDVLGFRARTGDAGWRHFFIDDRRFEAVWRNPVRWLGFFSKLRGFVGFDFSCLDSWPSEINVWNAYRSVLLTLFYSKSLALPAVPVSSWWSGCESQAARYIKPGSAVAVGSYPLKGGNQRVYLEGLSCLLEQVQPSELHIFGNLPPAESLRGVPFHRYDLYYHGLNRKPD
jgi:hypothetical protein